MIAAGLQPETVSPQDQAVEVVTPCSESPEPPGSLTMRPWSRAGVCIPRCTLSTRPNVLNFSAN